MCSLTLRLVLPVTLLAKLRELELKDGTLRGAHAKAEKVIAVAGTTVNVDHLLKKPFCIHMATKKKHLYFLCTDQRGNLPFVLDTTESRVRALSSGPRIDSRIPELGLLPVLSQPNFEPSF